MSSITPTGSGNNIIIPPTRANTITPNAPASQPSQIQPGGGSSITPSAPGRFVPGIPGVADYDSVMERTNAKIDEHRQRQQEHIDDLLAYFLWEEKTRDEVEGKKKWDEMDKEEGDTRFRQVLDKFKDRLKEGGIDLAKELTIKGLDMFSKRILSKMEGRFAKMGSAVLERVLPKMNAIWSKSVGKVGQLDTALLITDLVSSALVEATGIYSSRSHPAWTHDVENIPVIGSLVSTSFNLGNIIAVALGLEKSDAQLQKESALRYLDDFRARIHSEVGEKIGQLEKARQNDVIRRDAIPSVMNEEYTAQAEALGMISTYGLPPGSSREAVRDFAKRYVEARAPPIWANSYKQAVAREISAMAFIELNPNSPQAVAYRNKIASGDFIGVD